MAKKIMTNVGCYLGSIAFASQANRCELIVGPEAVDVSGFSPLGWREYAVGPKTARFSIAGHNDAPLDASLFAIHGVDDSPLTIVDADTAGNVAYLFKSSSGEYNQGVRFGESYSFEISGAMSSGIPTRGMMLHSASGATSTVNGDEFQVGAVSASQAIYANLHVLSAGGTPTLDVKLQSDDSEAFSSPTDRLTFTQFTDVGAEWKRAAPGAVTDTWWRMVATIGGSSPDLDFVVSMGIGPA